MLQLILTSITTETELIEQDNLARGQYTRTASLSVTIPEKQEYGFLDAEPLGSGYRADDPAEWWGPLSVYAEDVVSALHTYPWMPTQVGSSVFF